MIKTFKMKLYPGMEEEYERRHNELWPAAAATTPSRWTRTR